jgi:pimeloyl-ACP methyl ester carboxylesterase
VEKVNAVTDEAARQARRAAIDAVAPGATLRTIRWSGGSTEAIELGAGEPILLIHGGAGEAGHWLPLMPLLADSHRVIAVDAPGHGLADPYAFTGDLYSLGARFIGDVFDAVGLRRAIVGGNSMGGLYAVGFGIASPQRVSQLLLIGAPAGANPRAPLPLKLLRWPWTRPLATKIMRNRDAAAVRRRLGRMLVAHPERLDDALVASFAATTARNVPSLTRFVSRAIDLRGRLRGDVLIAPRLAELPVPATFIWGERDRTAEPDTGERLVAGTSCATLVRIADAGHQPALDDPRAVAHAIRAALGATYAATRSLHARGPGQPSDWAPLSFP